MKRFGFVAWLAAVALVFGVWGCSLEEIEALQGLFGEGGVLTGQFDGDDLFGDLDGDFFGDLDEDFFGDLDEDSGSGDDHDDDKDDDHDHAVDHDGMGEDEGA